MKLHQTIAIACLGLMALTPVRGQEAELKLTELLKTVGVKPGMTVAEVTSGPGGRVHHYVAAVGAKGQVYAVAFHEENLEKIRQLAKTHGWTNVSTGLGSHKDESVGLPDGKIEMAVLLDTFVHFRRYAEMLGHLRHSLVPGGRVAIVEFVPEKQKEKVKKDRDQIVKEVEANGFHLERKFDYQSDRFVLVFKRT